MPEERERRRPLAHSKLRMIAYADTAGCLRATILRYFGNPAAPEPCGACGTCDRREPIGEADRLVLRKINLLLYYGVLGARSAWRSRLQARDRDGPTTGGQGATDVESSSRPAAPIPPRTNWLWAELMQRSFGFDVLACPRCGDRLELITLIEDRTVIRRILGHLGLPTDVPAARPARPPPLPIGRSDSSYDEDVSVP